MTKKLVSFVMLVMLLPALALAQDRDVEERAEGPGMDEEMSLTRSQVPSKVLAAAERAKPGAFFSDIRRSLRDDDNTYYTFSASQVGKYYVIVVRADAQLMSVDEEGEAPARGKK